MLDLEKNNKTKQKTSIESPFEEQSEQLYRKSQ